jgi:hypothetical protein
MFITNIRRHMSSSLPLLHWVCRPQQQFEERATSCFWIAPPSYDHSLECRLGSGNRRVTIGLHLGLGVAEAMHQHIPVNHALTRAPIV